MKRILFPACLLVAAVSPALADSTFPNTCSQIEFAYAGNDPTIKAVCLKADGTTNPTSLTIQGINNENGMLKQGTGPSTFQKSCGNIRVIANGTFVQLSAQCRATSGMSQPTSVPLNGISNNNGVLSQ
jgi:hypothetical protein